MIHVVAARAAPTANINLAYKQIKHKLIGYECDFTVTDNQITYLSTCLLALLSLTDRWFTLLNRNTYRNAQSSSRDRGALPHIGRRNAERLIDFPWFSFPPGVARTGLCRGHGKMEQNTNSTRCCGTFYLSVTHKKACVGICARPVGFHARSII